LPIRPAFIETAEDTARNILRTNVDKLHKLARALLEKEIIDSEDVNDIIGKGEGDAEEVESPISTPEK